MKIKQKAERAYRALIAASQHNDIKQSDSEAQIVDLFCKMKHFCDEYGADVDECMKQAHQQYLSDLSAEQHNTDGSSSFDCVV